MRSAIRNRRLTKSKENGKTDERTTINNQRKTLKETKGKWADNKMNKERIQLPYILPGGILSTQTCALLRLNLTSDSFPHLTLPSALGTKVAVGTEFPRLRLSRLPTVEMIAWDEVGVR